MSFAFSFIHLLSIFYFFHFMPFIFIFYFHKLYLFCILSFVILWFFLAFCQSFGFLLFFSINICNNLLFFLFSFTFHLAFLSTLFLKCHYSSNCLFSINFLVFFFYFFISLDMLHICWLYIPPHPSFFMRFSHFMVFSSLLKNCLSFP